MKSRRDEMIVVIKEKKLTEPRRGGILKSMEKDRSSSTADIKSESWNMASAAADNTSAVLKVSVAIAVLF